MRHMSNDLHHLHLLLFGGLLQDPVTDDAHLRILFALFLRFHPEFAIPHEIRYVIIVRFHRRFRILVDYLQGGVALREFERLLVIETHPGVMVGDPRREFTAIVMVVD